MITIVDYTPQYQAIFRDLNKEWIEKYFKIEPSDIEQLEYADQEIIGKGGYIFLASWAGEIVGTVALVKDDDDLYELVKMAVAPKAQGKKIGYLLMVRALEKAKEVGAKHIYIESNRKLVPAITLYKKMGFIEGHYRDSPYERADIQLMLNL
jgi:GNAT superfamily N-acetyltransferase